jgi:hypothetical protein
LKPHHIVGGPNIFLHNSHNYNYNQYNKQYTNTHTNNNTNPNIMDTPMNLSKHQSGIKNRQKTDKRNNKFSLQFISDRSLDCMYKNYETTIKENKNKKEDTILGTLNKDNKYSNDNDNSSHNNYSNNYNNYNSYNKIVNRALEKQEKLLQKYEKTVNDNLDFNKKISQKINRPVDALLMNGQTKNDYRLKLELKDYVEKSKTLETRYGSNGWVLSLRRPKKLEGIHENYINVGKESKPYWVTVREKSNDYIEKIRDPFSTNSDNNVKIPGYITSDYFYMNKTETVERISTEPKTVFNFFKKTGQRFNLTSSEYNNTCHDDDDYLMVIINY